MKFDDDRYRPAEPDPGELAGGSSGELVGCWVWMSLVIGVVAWLGLLLELNAHNLASGEASMGPGIGGILLQLVCAPVGLVIALVCIILLVRSENSNGNPIVIYAALLLNAIIAVRMLALLFG